MLSVNTTYELRSIFVPTTRIGTPTDGSNCIQPGHYISEASPDIVSGTKGKNHYNFKSEFETRRDKMVDQDFGRQNDPMSRPTLDSTPLGSNTTNGTTLSSDLIPVGTKSPKPTPLTLTTDSPGYPDPDPLLSDSSSKKSNYSNDTNSITSNKKKHEKKEKHWKYKKDDSSDPSSSNDSDSSYDSDYRRKRRKRKSDQKKDPMIS